MFIQIMSLLPEVLCLRHQPTIMFNSSILDLNGQKTVLGKIPPSYW